MKKVLLSMMVVGALLATSCKSEKKSTLESVKDAKTEMKKELVKKVEEVEEVVEETKTDVSNMINSAIEGVSIPKFENEAVTEHLQTYATYAKDFIAAKGDVLKNAKLAKQGVELAAKGKELLGSLDAESATKFKSVLNAIKSKMASVK
ncbi:hypothetical protein [uncultured Polaribacter sp.]|uniref:hypothetical protein n=1 Tax=uncultured Polaribacter sp. TaxID=174711 RepID=UPI002638C4D5|nr:hypothetical protein [uncultured Polaribacter sp.]